MQYGILTFKDPEIDKSKKIIHVDMDAFYASVEMRDHPELLGKPVVIAKHPKLTGGRGIVSTCNYEARSYGIHSAMSALEAYRRCPQAVFISGNHQHYREVSQQIQEIFKRYTNKIQTVALDEAYLDVTHNKKAIPSATFVAQEIQGVIKEELGLSCSVGVSYNKFLAKIASDYHKPFGITVVEPEQALEFLDQLPIEKFHGVGQKSLPVFLAKGIHTGKDLRALSLESLINDFGKMGYSLYYKVRGISSNQVEYKQMRKSIGKERTFSEFLVDESHVLSTLYKLTEQVIDRMQKYHLTANTITIKIRYQSFQTITRQISSLEPIADFSSCWDYVNILWQTHGHLDDSIRLLGVSVSNFNQNDFSEIQLDL